MASENGVEADDSQEGTDSDQAKIGPLQLSIHVVQNRHVGTLKSHWNKTNKGNSHLKLCMPFVGLAPLRLLRPNMAVLYHVNGKLQSTPYLKERFCYLRKENNKMYRFSQG